MTGCFLHNPGEAAPAAYLLRFPTGQDVPLCAACYAWWRADTMGSSRADPMVRPVWIISLHGADTYPAHLYPGYPCHRCDSEWEQ